MASNMTDCSFTAAVRPSSCQRLENKASDRVTTRSASRTEVLLPWFVTHSTCWLFALFEPQLQNTARILHPSDWMSVGVRIVFFPAMAWQLVQGVDLLSATWDRLRPLLP